MKGRKSRNTGGVNEAEKDLKSKPERYNNSRVEGEAEEKKAGGRAKRKSGGMTECKVEGDVARKRADRKPRKSGGNATANPFSSARSGTAPAGHKVEMECD